MYKDYPSFNLKVVCTKIKYYPLFKFKSKSVAKLDM